MAAATGKQRAASPDKVELWQHKLPPDTKGFGQFQRRTWIESMQRSDEGGSWPEPLGAIDTWTWFRYKSPDIVGGNRLGGLGVLLLKDGMGFRKALFTSSSVSPSFTGARVKNWALSYEKQHGQLPFYVLPGVRHIFVDTADGSVVVAYADLLPEGTMGRLAEWSEMKGSQHARVEPDELYQYEMFPFNKQDPTSLFHGGYCTTHGPGTT